MSKNELQSVYSSGRVNPEGYFEIDQYRWNKMIVDYLDSMPTERLSLGGSPYFQDKAWRFPLKGITMSNRSAIEERIPQHLYGSLLKQSTGDKVNEPRRPISTGEYYILVSRSANTSLTNQERYDACFERISGHPLVWRTFLSFLFLILFGVLLHNHLKDYDNPFSE